MGKLSNEE